MKDSEKIVTFIQSHQIAQELEKQNKEPERRYTCNIKQGAEITPFRSEEQVRDEVMLKSKPVRIRDKFTGEITKFDGYKQCVDYMGVNWVTFERMLHGRTLYYHNWQLLRDFDK